MGIQHLTGKSLANIPIPVPPLAELQRIVKKVEILFQLLDKLEQEISNVKLYAFTFAYIVYKNTCICYIWYCKKIKNF